MPNSSFIPVCAPVFTGRERDYVLQAVDSGWISSSGEFIQRFEQTLARLCNVHHVESCANGTVALHVLFVALGIGPGDEVIVPSETFVASANAVAYCGATPVFCEIDPKSWVLDAADAIARITPATKAILGVDLFGVLVDYDDLRARLRSIGREDIFIIEDAAESIGSTFQGRPAGSLADAAIFSFFGNKTITTGEGGAVVTNKIPWGEKIRFLKNHGMSTQRRYYHPEMGFNYRMTNVQAAIGCAQTEAAADLFARKKRIGYYYKEQLKHVSGIRFAEIPQGQDVVPWLHAIVDESLKSEQARDELLIRMRDHGVETRPFFVPVHLFPYYSKSPVAGPGALPITESIAARGLAFPSGGDLTFDQVNRVIEVFLQCREKVS